MKSKGIWILKVRTVLLPWLAGLHHSPYWSGWWKCLNEDLCSGVCNLEAHSSSFNSEAAVAPDRTEGKEVEENKAKIWQKKQGPAGLIRGHLCLELYLDAQFQLQTLEHAKSVRITWNFCVHLVATLPVRDIREATRIIWVFWGAVLPVRQLSLLYRTLCWAKLHEMHHCYLNVSQCLFLSLLSQQLQAQFVCQGGMCTESAWKLQASFRRTLFIWTTEGVISKQVPCRPTVGNYPLYVLKPIAHSMTAQ